MVYMYIIMCKFVRGIKPMQCHECVVAKPLSESVRQDIDQILTLKGFFFKLQIYLFIKNLTNFVPSFSFSRSSFPGFPPTRPYGAREREPGNEVGQIFYK